MWKFFAIVAVFTLVAFLLTVDKVTGVVDSGLASARIKSPGVAEIQGLAMHFVKLGLAVMLLLISSIVLVPIVKFSLILVGLGLLYAAVKEILKLFR